MFSVAEFTGRDAGSFYVKITVSSNGRYLISGSTDKSLCIWSTEKAEMRKGPIPTMARLHGHMSEVMAGDITQHGRTVVRSKIITKNSLNYFDIDRKLC